MRVRVDSLRKEKRLVLYQIDASTPEAAIYLKLTHHPDPGYKVIGSGEAAAIVLTKEYDGILGSNNMRDILP